MAKIKHIAIATQDPEKTAQFYKEVFGLREIAKINSPGATGFHLTDGDINFAVLKFKNDQTAGVPQGKEYSGLHHIGFEVDSIEAVDKKLAGAGAPIRDDINQALGFGPQPGVPCQRRGQIQRPGRCHHRHLRNRLGRHGEASAVNLQLRHSRENGNPGFL